MQLVALTTQVHGAEGLVRLAEAWRGWHAVLPLGCLGSPPWEAAANEFLALPGSPMRSMMGVGGSDLWLALDVACQKPC